MAVKLTTEEAISCGYVTSETLAAANKLSEQDVRLLAAMALTWDESEWSDKWRDLKRGIDDLLQRPRSA